MLTILNLNYAHIHYAFYFIHLQLFKHKQINKAYKFHSHMLTNLTSGISHYDTISMRLTCFVQMLHPWVHIWSFMRSPNSLNKSHNSQSDQPITALNF